MKLQDRTGQAVPNVVFRTRRDHEWVDVTSNEVFEGKTVAVFALPGAFTPTCSAQHVPSYLKNAAALRDKGVDTIACLSVNDVFVMGAWGKDQGSEGQILMLADGSGDFTKAAGMELDLTARGLGVRSHRYAMIVEDGVVKALHLEENPGELGNSGAESMLAEL